jgi:hypothetical protein
VKVDLLVCDVFHDVNQQLALNNFDALVKAGFAIFCGDLNLSLR